MGSIDYSQGGIVDTTLPYKYEGAYEPGLYYAGTIAQYRRKMSATPVQIHDIKDAKDTFSLNKQGFQLVQHVSSESTYDDEERIKSVVYDETAELVRNVTKANRVHILSHLVRRGKPETARAMADDPSLSGMQQVGMTVPSNGVHIDQSEAGAFAIARDNVSKEEGEKLDSTHWAIVNVWRPIKTVTRDPLCLCDGRTVVDDDLHPVTVNLPPKGTGTYDGVSNGGTFETLEVKARTDRHKWYYASRLQPDEALVFKCYESKSANNDNNTAARRVPHTSFTIPGTEDEPARQSIELRCLVMY